MNRESLRRGVLLLNLSQEVLTSLIKQGGGTAGWHPEPSLPSEPFPPLDPRPGAVVGGGGPRLRQGWGRLSAQFPWLLALGVALHGVLPTPRRLGPDETEGGRGPWVCHAACGGALGLGPGLPIPGFHVALTEEVSRECKGSLCAPDLSLLGGMETAQQGPLRPGPAVGPRVGGHIVGLSGALCLCRVHCQLVRLFARGIEEPPRREWHS